MAVITVHALVGFAVFAGTAVDFSSELDEHAFSPLSPPLVPYVLGAAIGASVTSNLPISEIGQSKSGARSTSFWDDFYNRIHVQPPVLDVGNVVSVQTYDVEVWNAYDAPKQFIARAEVGTAGLFLAGVAAPATWRALESKTYVLTATPEVEFVVEAVYTFTFVSANQAVLQVIGRGDVVVLPLSPDWASTVKERLQWSTDVQRSQGGLEQRIRLLDQPRRAWTMVLRALTGEAVRRWESIIFRQQPGRFAVPVWTDGQRLPAALPAASVSVPGIVTAGLDFVDGGLAVLWRSAEDFEPITITTVGSGELQLYSPTLATWPAGTRLYPAQLARMASSQRLRRPIERVAELPITLDVVENRGLLAADSGPTYRGFRVMDTKPHEPDVPEETWGRFVEVIDNGAASPVVDDRSGFPEIVRPMRWLVGTRAEAKALRAWLHARAGRLVPCWLPTWRADLIQTQTLSASGVQLVVEHVEFSRFVSGWEVRRDLMIRHANGSTFFRRILSAAEVNDFEEGLTLDAALGVIAAPGDLTISFLDLVRLEADSAEIVWETDGVAGLSVQMRTVAQ